MLKDISPENARISKKNNFTILLYFNCSKNHINFGYCLKIDIWRDLLQQGLYETLSSHICETPA